MKSGRLSVDPQIFQGIVETEIPDLDEQKFSDSGLVRLDPQEHVDFAGDS